jgi:hypothetical protein
MLKQVHLEYQEIPQKPILIIKRKFAQCAN